MYVFMKGFIKFLRSIEVPQAKWNRATLAFLIWGGLCLVANLFCTNANAFGGDQGYWADWVKKLAEGGFEKFNGN